MSRSSNPFFIVAPLLLLLLGGCSDSDPSEGSGDLGGNTSVVSGGGTLGMGGTGAGGRSLGGATQGGAAQGGTGQGGAGQGGLPPGSGGVAGSSRGGSGSGGSGFGGTGVGGNPWVTGGSANGGSGPGGAVGWGGAADGGVAGTSNGGTAFGGTSQGGAWGGSPGGTDAGGSGDGGSAVAGAAQGGTGEAGSGPAGAPGAGGAEAGTGNLPNLSVYIASDSTAATYTDTASTTDQAGWGQMLHEIFTDQVTVVNRSAGGRTARWFYLEGAVDRILSEGQPGDYFFIQFGTNDSNRNANFEVNGVTYPRYADPQTDFKTYLLDYYLDPIRERGMVPVLVTPPPRNSAYCGTGNALAAHSQAAGELGEAEGVAVLDLNTKTFDHLSAICPSPTPEDFYFLRTDGTVDGTHFQENGARHMAGFLGECMVEIDLSLAAYLLEN